MTSTVLVRHTPTTLNLSDLDDCDAFDPKDDTPENLPYVFSPDAIREELAKNIPFTHEEWDTHINASHAVNTPFDNDEQNLSVSTLDIGPNVSPPQSPETSTAESLDSPEFTQIHLSTSVEDDIDPSTSEGQWNEMAKSRSFASGIVRQGRPQSLDLKLEPPSLPSAGIDSSKQDTPAFSASSFGSALHSAGFTNVSESSSTPKSPNSVRSPASDPAAGTSVSLPNMLSTSTPPPATLLTEKSVSHRPHRSVGPSTLEKVRSKTRPTFLPPKPRKEDDKHMSDWEQMMRQSRLVCESRSDLTLYFLQIINRLS